MKRNNFLLSVFAALVAMLPLGRMRRTAASAVMSTVTARSASPT